MISDCSSASARSPNYGASPIELPPLSGARHERRQSAAPMLRVGVPGSFVNEQEMNAPGLLMKPPPPHMLQEPFLSQQQQAIPQPLHYLPSQPRHPSPIQQMPASQQYQLPSNVVVRGNFPAHVSQLPSTPTPPMQLPSISNLAVSGRRTPVESLLAIDPALTGARMLPSQGSPKDKMSLSNLTH